MHSALPGYVVNAKKHLHLWHPPTAVTLQYNHLPSVRAAVALLLMLLLQPLGWQLQPAQCTMTKAHPHAVP
jgi:hypothetical protein